MLKDYKGLTHLKSMDIEQLKKLSDEIRQEIIDCVSKNGGHLASSLGAVELAVALHYVFNSPYDSIIWDVGHQAYPHKILTGRDLSSLRTKGGVAGFPKPEESIHDPFVAGHAGISISEAAGLAKLRPDNFVIAVIGDGSMTSGVVYEAMNHAGAMKLKNLIVILNDNDMSISENVGAISSFISKNIVNNAYYQKMRSEIKSLIASFPLQKTFNINLVELIKKIRSSAISLIAPEAFFEAFGFRYIGPFDGHDLEVLIKTFRNVPVGEEDSSPILFHVVTKKGKGYLYAEDDPSLFHGVSCFDAVTGITENKKTLPTFTSIFGEALTEIAEKESSVVAITAAMKEGTGLNSFENKFKNRFYDVGIAEQHAVSFAAGLAKSGAKPVVAIYSTFIQRSLDQIIHDVALNNLHVIFCLDRAGLVGEDGATHHGAFDLSFIRCIPNVSILAPSNSSELRNMLYYAIAKCSGPVFLRYPRGCVPEWEYENYKLKKDSNVELGKARVIFESKSSNKPVAVFAAGYSAYVAKVAAEKIVESDPSFSVKVYDARFVKPVDSTAIAYETKNSCGIVTVEENSLMGGFGSAVIESIFETNPVFLKPIKRIGIQDLFVHHGTQHELRKDAGINIDAVKSAILGIVELKG